MAEVTNLRQRHENWTRGGPVVSLMDENEITALETRAAATVADPSPLGLWAFATGTWIMGVVIALFPPSSHPAILPIVAAFAGVAQFIAGLYAYRRANVLMATAFCSFGSFYVMIASYFGLELNGYLPVGGNTASIIGFMYESFAFIALALALASLRLNLALFAVFGCMCVGLALAGIPEWANTAGAWNTIAAIGGWFLFASGMFAAYAGAAMIVNSTSGRMVLPIMGEP